MNNEVHFYRIASERRVQIDKSNLTSETLRAVLYINAVVTLAETFGLPDFEVKPINMPDDPSTITAESIRGPLLKVENYIGTLHGRNIFEIDDTLKQSEIIELDETWKAKATTFVQHIRNVVQRAELEPADNDRIMARIAQLQSEIDRKRTRIEAVTQVWLALTEAAGKGVKNLEPAIGLIDRIGGSFGGLFRANQEGNAPKQLPAPETLGLPDLTDDPPDDPFKELPPQG